LGIEVVESEGEAAEFESREDSVEWNGEVEGIFDKR
jgi:hypothetical protein